MKSQAGKVGIIGSGAVGTTVAFTLLLEGITNELVLVSRSEAKAQGEVLDLEHGLPFLEYSHIVATSDFAKLEGSDVVVVTAGAKQKPGQTRLEIAQENSTIIEDLIPKILSAAPEAVVLLVSNPVDILTYKADQIAGGANGRIFGSGTTLDTARFRVHLAEFLNVNPRSIHAYVLGEHGDSSFHNLSSATIGGQLVHKHPQYSPEKAEQAFQDARTAAYKIIDAKGATFYAIAVVVANMVRNILGNHRSILPVSAPLTGQYGHNDIAISLPCVIGRNGVERIMEIELSNDEQAQLEHSIQTIRQHM